MTHSSKVLLAALSTAVAVALCASGGCKDGPQPTHQSRYAEEIQSLDGELQIHLEFSNSSITDDDLVSLPFSDTVRSISLRGTAITDRGVAELKRAKNLERLDLRGTQITDRAIDELKLLSRLWEANVGSTQMSPDAQQELVKILSRRRSVIEYDLSRVVAPPTGPPDSRSPSP